MKIAIIGTRGIPARHGGFETFAERLSVYLVEHGHEVVVYCEQSEGERLARFRSVELAYLPRLRLGPLTTIFHDGYALAREMRGADIVYLLGYGAAIFGCLPRLAGKTLLINMDGIEWQREKWNFFPARQWFKLMEWTAVRLADWIVADAKSIGDFLARRHRLNKPMKVIEYGTDLPAESAGSGGPSDDVPGYLVVARIEPENMVREIIEGYLAAGSKYDLHIVGNCEANAYGRALLTEFGERPNIHFHGAIYDRRVLNDMRLRARAHLHGHRVGGTNPSLLEAMAYTGVVVAHDNPHNREVLGNTGIFFDDRDALSARISELDAVEDTRLAEYREAARDRISGKYSWTAICERYRLFLEEIGAASARQA